MSDSVTIEGKEFLTTPDAARLVGYTKDYVGQLAREGRLVARQIGRIWYVSSESIQEHKKESNYVLVKSKKKKNTQKDYKNIVFSEKIQDKKNNQESIKNTIIYHDKKDDSESKNLQKTTHDPLSYTSVVYEGGSPVFYEDYGPNIPVKEKKQEVEEKKKTHGEDVPMMQRSIKRDEEKSVGRDILSFENIIKEEVSLENSQESAPSSLLGMGNKKEVLTSPLHLKEFQKTEQLAVLFGFFVFFLFLLIHGIF
jgi:excisionase family DNA binding protein